MLKLDGSGITARGYGRDTSRSLAQASPPRCSLGLVLVRGEREGIASQSPSEWPPYGDTGPPERSTTRHLPRHPA